MERSEEVGQAIERFYEAFTAGDAGSFDLLVSREAQLVIGTAPHEWVEGREAMRAQFGMEGIRLEGGAVSAWQDGSIGWLADRPRFVLPDGSAVATRLTAVLRHEDGAWKIVQAHFSVGIPDEEAAELQDEAA